MQYKKSHHLSKAPAKTAVFFLAVLAFSCQVPLWTNHAGKETAPDLRIEMKAGGPHTAAWDSEEVVLTLQYTRTADRLDLSVKAELVGSLQNFSKVDDFFLSCFFLDKQGIVIAERPLLTAGGGTALEPWSFRRELRLPPDTVFLSFGYSGQVNTGDFDSSPWYFAKTPFTH